MRKVSDIIIPLTATSTSEPQKNESSIGVTIFDPLSAMSQSHLSVVIKVANPNAKRVKHTQKTKPVTDSIIKQIGDTTING